MPYFIGEDRFHYKGKLSLFAGQRKNPYGESLALMI
jgi:hypothetical protein